MRPPPVKSAGSREPRARGGLPERGAPVFLSSHTSAVTLPPCTRTLCASIFRWLRWLAPEGELPEKASGEVDKAALRAEAARLAPV